VRYSPRQRPAVMISMLRLSNRAAALARRCSSQVITGINASTLAQKPVALVAVKNARQSGGRFYRLISQRSEKLLYIGGAEQEDG
jgi:hypothetical protein